MLTPRQELLLRKVVDSFATTGQPVGSKVLASEPDVTCGSSTIRYELAVLEERGLLAHPHTSAGRVPTDAGYRYFVDNLLPVAAPERHTLELQLVRREVDEAMRTATETLSQITNLLALVSAPPIGTTTIRHVEVLLLQPQVLMVVVITSTGGVSKRVFTYERSVAVSAGSARRLRSVRAPTPRPTSCSLRYEEAQAVRPGSTGRGNVNTRLDTPPVEVIVTTMST